MIANSGCRARLIKDATKKMTTTEIAVGTTTVGDDRILENLDVILVFVPRNQVTHHHHRHPHHPRHQTDIHGGHTIADNPPPPAAGVELSVVLYEMFDSLRDFDREQYRNLWQQIVANFQGTYKRHAIEDDLHALTQNPGESLRDYVRRFNECRNMIPEIIDASVIRSFKTGTTLRLLLTPTDQPFHGITPQSSSKPLGKITLPVTFGQANNFRTEQITGFDTAYNAIIRRTALAKFMAGSHYAYQVLKMPGPKGTITIQGNAKLAGQCDRRSLDMVEHTPNPPATAEPPKKVSKTNKKPKPDDTIKIVPLSSAIPDKTVKIGASLDEK
uniref:Retrotransposon protein, putative, Ty3-gypsy sub-class n=2 Tax=Oryza sativa subsp. japonica TaxID=39947 RepID=Q2R5E6_ORYSJ|nr:retrotransposon protein, putative, Ty3-gypsy sub-class [Oryza sativa Japonica Group]ABA93336.1 retrotransposon protein, putative, Ty3-gypsy subclass [Oryza sativa Japonica Group]